MQQDDRPKGARPISEKRKKRALGRGLDALIPDLQAFDNTGRGDTEREYFLCDIEMIQPNRYQPRIQFSETEIDELCRSIKKQGIIQPLLVRKDSAGYELIAGERRLRAAKKAGFRQVPVVIKSVSDSDMLEMSLVENIHRENLNPLEEAEAYFRLIDEFDLTQDEAAVRLGKSRSAVANILRLRHLPEPIKASILDGGLSMGHARALLGAETTARQLEAWRTVLSRGLSVRETEKLVKRMASAKTSPGKREKNSDAIHFVGLEEELSRYFGTRVKIKRRGQKGKVEVEFYDDEDLDRLIRLLQPR